MITLVVLGWIGMALLIITGVVLAAVALGQMYGTSAMVVVAIVFAVATLSSAALSWGE